MDNLPTEKRLYLASASPRRRELLAKLGLRFMVVVSRFDESTLSSIADGAAYVRAAAESKASEVASRRDGLILGVDTDVIAPDGTILGKPTDADDAFRILKKLCGATHRVCTAVALLEAASGDIVRRDLRLVESLVTFADVPDTALRAYIATGEPMDKAGAYAIQGGAMAFITHIDGDLSAIIGLPLTTVADILTDFDVPLYRFDAAISSHGAANG